MNTFANTLNRFFKAEDGMVTVEWVALSAAVTVGGIAIAWVVLDSLDTVAAGIGDTISTKASKVQTGANPAMGNGK